MGPDVSTNLQGQYPCPYPLALLYISSPLPPLLLFRHTLREHRFHSILFLLHSFFPSISVAFSLREDRESGKRRWSENLLSPSSFSPSFSFCMPSWEARGEAMRGLSSLREQWGGLILERLSSSTLRTPTSSSQPNRKGGLSLLYCQAFPPSLPWSLLTLKGVNRYRGTNNNIASVSRLYPDSSSFPVSSVFKSEMMCKIEILVAYQVRGDIQDSHPGLPVCDAGQPRGCTVRARDAGSPVQADISKEQGDTDRSLCHLLPPGWLPQLPPEARSGFPIPGGHQEDGPSHWLPSLLYIGFLGWWTRHKHLPWTEKGDR